jgi:hypothetical protein
MTSSQAYYHPIIKRNSHRRNPTETLPYCTHSQIVNYYDASGNRVAVVHQCVLPDGSIGGSGRPEPKRIWIGGVSFYPPDDPEAA